MPKLKPHPFEEKRRAARAFISASMDLGGADEETLALKLGVTKRTLQNKRKRPETITLEEFWRMCDCLKPDEKMAVAILLGVKGESSE